MESKIEHKFRVQGTFNTDTQDENITLFCSCGWWGEVDDDSFLDVLIEVANQHKVDLRADDDPLVKQRALLFEIRSQIERICLHDENPDDTDLLGLLHHVDSFLSKED